MAKFRKWMALPMALTALALAVLLWRQVDGGWTDRGAQSTAASGDIFSPAALAKARATGKPVFVYFTANWCLSCKDRKSVVLGKECVSTCRSRWSPYH